MLDRTGGAIVPEDQSRGMAGMGHGPGEEMKGVCRGDTGRDGREKKMVIEPVI